MTYPQFTQTDGITFTFRTGEVDSVDVNITTQLDFDSMPGITPDGALLQDVNGVLKVINIQGKLFNDGSNCLTGTGAGNVTTIDEQRQWLEAHLNGQQVGLTFASNYSSTYNGSTFANSKVLFSRFRHREEVGNPEFLPFEIDIYVGDV